LRCLPSQCPLGQACGLLHGAPSCLELPGRCSLAPPTGAVSFDGAQGPAMAPGVYVIAALCDACAGPWFRLLADVGEALRGLHLFSAGAFITITSDRKLWVNGIPSTIPTEVPGGLNITEVHGSIRISQSSLEIGFIPGREVAVTAAPELGGKLCGICGNYDGNAANDLQGPDGTLVGSMEAMAKAWRAPDFTH
ncbi:FCGBP protein, partial [Probosciger aterrimus]|nr:FCGBP protein [Probosciger aterrimus]